MPRTWKLVTYTNSPERWGVRLEHREGEHVVDYVDLPLTGGPFEHRGQAEALIEECRKAEIDPHPVDGGKWPPGEEDPGPGKKEA